VFFFLFFFFFFFVFCCVFLGSVRNEGTLNSLKDVVVGLVKAHLDYGMSMIFQQVDTDWCWYFFFHGKTN